MSEKRTFKHKNVTNNNIVNRKGENIMNKTTFRKEDEIIEAGTFHKREGEKKMNDIIFVHKQAGAKKDAVRVSSNADIPEFLKGAVRVNGDKLEIECVEGNETANFGEVIGYEKSEKTNSGYNCWVIGNASTNLIEKDGVFYKKATVMRAAQVTEDSIPSFLEGAEVRQNEDKSWTIKTDWGESTGRPYEAYWVLYGFKEDGKPDANILTKTEKSFSEYIVCDENGQDICQLSELED